MNVTIKVWGELACLCETFFDIRTFGAVMTTGVNCGQVRGPAQITFSRSIDPIVPMEIAITRKSVTTDEEAEKQAKNDGSVTCTMGRKSTVPYALYRGHGFINPLLAKDTGFTFGICDYSSSRWCGCSISIAPLRAV